MDSGFSFQDAYFLLRRNWFLDMEDIDEFLWSLTDDVFEKVVQTKYSYSPRIRTLLYVYEEKPRSAKELSYDEMTEHFKHEDRERIQKRKASMKEYVAPPRPRMHIDDEYDTLVVTIKNEKYKLTTFKSRSQIEKLEATVHKLENGFEEIKQRIEAQDRIWHELQWIRNVVFASERHTSL